MLEGDYIILPNDELMTPEQYVEASLASMKFYAWSSLTIKSDRTGTGPFLITESQDILDVIAQEMLRQVGYIRIILTKNRRRGITTYVQGRKFRHMHLSLDFEGMTITHRDDATDYVFQMLKRFYEYLPLQYLRPTEDKSNKKQLAFTDTRALATVFTAGGRNIGHAFGGRFIHFSEVSRYNDADETMKGPLQVVRRFPGTEVWIESVPNGMGGIGKPFYDTYSQSCKVDYSDLKNIKVSKGENEYWGIFFPWHSEQENRMRFARKEDKEDIMESIVSHRKDYTYGDEMSEMKRYNLDWEQMNWRRYMIDNECRGDLDTFREQYPSDDESCFLSSSNAVFPLNICVVKRDTCRKPLVVGNLYYKDEEKNKVVLEPESHGFLSIWKFPEQLAVKNRYAGGGDISEGKIGSDYNDFPVLDRMVTKHKEFIACWHGLLDHADIADEIYKLSLFYNLDIHWCIERNNDGKAVLSHLIKVYDNLYMREVKTPRGDKIKNEYGFVTEGFSKIALISQLVYYMRELLIDNNDEEFWSQCITYVREATEGKMIKMGAINKKKDRMSKNRRFDDKVIAVALAIEADRTMPPIVKDENKYPEWLKKEILEEGMPKSYLEA